MLNLRKTLTVGVMALTIFVMSGLASVVSAASAQPGDLVKAVGSKVVYYVGSDSKLYNIPNEGTYFSWYKDWSGVITISVSDLNTYGNGIPAGFVTMRPGTNLIKRDVTTDNTVYAVETNGTLRAIDSANALALYGSNWMKKVVKVSDQNFLSYSVKTALPVGQYPIGSLLKKTTGADVYYYDGTNYRKIDSAAAFNANRFNAKFVVKTSMSFTAGGTDITGVESDLINAAQNGGVINVNPNPVTGSGLTVSLNANSQAATTIISGAGVNQGGQAIAPLASFNLTAANDGAITVKSLRLKRIGVSSDNSLANIYLYNGNAKLTDAGSLSNGYVTFGNSNGIITVPAGQTVTITVKADVAAQANGNIGMSINAASDVVSTSANVSGSFPVSGNLMSITQVSDMAVVSVNTAATANGTTINAGTMAATLWSDNVSVSNKAVNLSYVSFRQIGSISADAIQNLKLFVNGGHVGTAASIDANGRVNFDFTSNPVLLNTGASTIELRGDIVKGSNYNYTFSIQTASDMVLTDTNYGVNVTMSAVSPAALPLSPVSTLINPGSVSVQRDSTFTATQFVANQSQTVLGQWTMKAYGEDVKVQSLQTVLTLAGTAASGEGFNNVTVYVNGATVGSSANAVSGFSSATDGTKTLTFGTTNLFTIPAGTQVTVAIKGDSVLNNPTSITSARADLVTPTNSLEGVTSFVYTPASPATYQGIALTSGSSNATVSANGSYASQTLSANTLKQKIGSYMIQASSVDGVNVTSLKVSLENATTSAALGSTDLNKLSNLYIVTPDMPNGSTPTSPTALNNFSTNFTVAANQTAEVDVYADLNDASIVHFKTNLAGGGIGSASHQSVVITGQDGQNIAVGNGSISAVALSGSSPVSQIIVGGTTAQPVATYTFTANTAGGATINELGFYFGASTAISRVYVGGQGANVVNGKATVTGLTISVPAGYQGTDVPVTADFAPVGLGGVSDQTVTVSLGHVKYVSGGVTTNNDATNFGTNVTGNIFSGATLATGLAANPMASAGVAPIVNLAAATGNLTTGVVKIGSVTVLAPTGNAIVTQLPLVITGSGITFATTSDTIVVKDASNGNTITSTGGTLGTLGGSASIVFNPTFTVPSGSTAKTFDIYANVATIAGNAGTGRATLGLNSDKTLFLWHDVTGNANLDATYIANYPNTTVSIVN